MALILDQLTVTRGGRRALDAVSATLRPGRVTALLGPNGAGKSTLVQAAAALLPAAGRVSLDGVDVATLPPRERARAIGYLPQDPVVAWDLTARELVALGCLPHRAPAAALAPADHAAIDAALAATDTATLADRTVATLSGGERARVLLARVLAGEPQWLLVDEPLASLDPAHRFDLLARLREAAARGAGVLIVLHDLVHAAQAADDVLLLDAGRLVAHGPAADVLTEANIARVFGVATTAIEADRRTIRVPIARMHP